MRPIKAGHTFQTEPLPQRRVDAVQQVSAADIRDETIIVGAPSRPFAIRAGVSGVLEEASLGARWLNTASAPIQRALTCLGDAMFLGQAIVTRSNGRIPVGGTLPVKPDVGDAIVFDGTTSTATRDIEITAVVDEPVLYLGHCPDQIGHFLMDYASRAWAVDWASGQGLRIAIYMPHRKVSRPLRIMNKALGIAEDVLVLREATLLRRVVVPSKTYQLSAGIHDDFLGLTEKISRRVASKASPVGARVYLSRKQWTKRRTLTNEQEVEDAFGRHGFDIVYPETLSFADQLALLRDAEHIAGPIGSQMLMGAFCRKPAIATILTPPDFMLPDDAILARARGASAHYIIGEADEASAVKARDQSFRVTIDYVERRLASLP